MAAKGEFRHEGVVKSVVISGDRRERGVVEVEVGTIAACEGCKAKSRCTSANAEKRVMRVECDDAWLYKAGDRVNIAISYGVGFMAVMLCYIAPLIIFIAALSTMITLGVNEGVAAILTFATIALYFWLVYKNRGKFEKRVEFRLTKL